MDMLDFEADELYFNEVLSEDAKVCLDEAALAYEKNAAEAPLLRAYFLEPEHPMVLVALYRYFYYQHRLDDALRVAERTLKIFAKRLNLPEDWRELSMEQVGGEAKTAMTLFRFYLLALKGAGYLELRLGRYESAFARLNKVVDLDSNDRLGAGALLDVAQDALNADAAEQQAGAAH